MLGVVWAVEHFKYFLYGTTFTLITDHQASISAVNNSERSKTSKSRLTTRIDRLISFIFDRKHLSGRKMGLMGNSTQTSQSESNTEPTNQNAGGKIEETNYSIAFSSAFRTIQSCHMRVEKTKQIDNLTQLRLKNQLSTEKNAGTMNLSMSQLLI